MVATHSDSLYRQKLFFRRALTAFSVRGNRFFLLPFGSALRIYLFLSPLYPLSPFPTAGSHKVFALGAFTSQYYAVLCLVLGLSLRLGAPVARRCEAKPAAMGLDPDAQARYEHHEREAKKHRQKSQRALKRAERKVPHDCESGQAGTHFVC